MARPIWSGTIAFGLLHIPVSLMPGERKLDLQFRLLDARDNTPVRYERVNAESGEEVPWKDIVKAFEYDKGSYVVLKPEDIAEAAVESHQTVDVEAFIPAGDVDLRYFEKPYVLVPGKRAEKGYVLLRETLRKSDRIGIARVVVRTREHLCAVVPHEDALLLMMLRYPQELVDLADYPLPQGKLDDYRISAKEIEMAQKLVESMAEGWRPQAYRDEYRERLGKVIEKRLRAKGKVAKRELPAALPENAATNVVDFMALLEESLASQRRAPAKKTAAGSRAAGSAPAAKKRPASRARNPRRKQAAP
jgi:DNA end-binding protein Ku